MGKCLELAGVIAQTTRDKDGRDAFIVFPMDQKIHGKFPYWYNDFHHKYGVLKVVYP